VIGRVEIGVSERKTRVERRERKRERKRKRKNEKEGVREEEGVRERERRRDICRGSKRNGTRKEKTSRRVSTEGTHIHLRTCKSLNYSI